MISRSITGDGGGMARIGRSKSDVGLDNKHSLQYYRRGMMDVLTRRLFPSSSPLFPPLQFDSSRSKRFYEISTTVPGLAFIHNHSKSFDFLSIEILRRRVCIFDSKHPIWSLGRNLFEVNREGWRKGFVPLFLVFHSLSLSSSRVGRSNRRIHDTQSGSQWRLSPRHG